MEDQRQIEFEWDDGNVEHIARHGYEPDEVEEVFGHRPVIRKEGARYLAYGRTSDGRMTVVIFEKRGRLRVVTAREMSARERKTFRRNE